MTLSREFSALRAALGEVRERRLALGYPARVGDLAEALGLAGNVEEGLLTIDEALQLAADNNEYWCTAELLRIKAELILMKGDEDGPRMAEALFVESPIGRVGRWLCHGNCGHRSAWLACSIARDDPTRPIVCWLRCINASPRDLRLPI